ncbi:Cd2+/Zn2+-exporting ATPase [Rhizobiales bacterium GAS113]|nr:Cd2+/Zn2+-exporting ATPase [Rhizobiales bacterium GAS113]
MAHRDKGLPQMTAPLTQSHYRVDGMDCPSCATKIATAARRVPGIADASVSVTAGTMTVRHGVDSDLAPLERKVEGLGYKVARLRPGPAPTPAAATCSHRHDHGQDHGHAHAHGGHAHTEDAHAGDTHAGDTQAGDTHDGAANASPAPSHAHDHGLDDPQAADGLWWRSRKARLTLLSGAALLIAFCLGKLEPTLGATAFTLAMLVGLVPIARRAVMAALAGTPFSIEMLMTVAALGAVAIGAAEEGATVVFLFLVGELLEGLAAAKARAGIRSLTSLTPRTALREVDGATREVPTETLPIGAVILVRPGERIAADGVILSGESAIDEAPVTGESLPVLKAQDAGVFAGTVNGEGVLRIRVTAAATDNTIARIVKLVEEAQEAKAPTERFIDRFSTYYTPAVVVLAALVALIGPLGFGGDWSAWIYKGLAILLIGCPCALVISTPAAIAASLSAGARRGLLLKGGAVLEKLGTVTLACFDKTGTLTQGKPVVTDVIGVGRSETEVLRLAAALEAGSSHPLAGAILARAASAMIVAPPATGARALAGKGVTGSIDGEEVFLGSAQAAAERVWLAAGHQARVAPLSQEGKTVSVLLVDGAIAGLIAMRDEPRPDAVAGLRALAEKGIRTIMLTGDDRRSAQAIGKRLAIEVRAGLLPQDKQRLVSELRGQGFIVAKIGDGINDAPALAAADIGIAMGGGTDVALETADAAALHGRVADVAAMIDLSKRTMANIRQNITVALGLKAAFLVTTIIGLTGLWPAILADTGATVLVTLNALRLLADGDLAKHSPRT